MKRSILTLSVLAIMFSACEKEEVEPTKPGPVTPEPKQEVHGCTNPNSFNYDPSATADNGSCSEMFGCLGFMAGFSNSGEIGNSFGDQYIDARMNEEIAIQNNFFSGHPAQVYVLYEPSFQHRNAYASPDKYILFGYHMMHYTLQSYGELAVAGILAHEWAHIVQFYNNWETPNPMMELEADAWSGFYMAMAKQWAWNQIEGYYQNTYAIGDYNFNHPQHHGTPNQRLSSAYLGVQTAISIMQSGQAVTYDQLHQHFMTEIQRILSSVGRSAGEFEEVTYPEGLSKEDIESLFPKVD